MNDITPNVWINGSRLSKTSVGLLGAAVLACLSMDGSTARGAFIEGFESPTVTASGAALSTSATGSTTSGWTNSGTSNATITSDSTTPAYAGSQYLRLLDTSSTTTSSATNAFASPVAANGSTISFALRDETYTDPTTHAVLFNNNQVVIRSPLSSGSQVALQIGIKANGSTATITATPYAGATAQTAVQTNISVAANDWYYFTINYNISPSLIGTYSLKIVDSNDPTHPYTASGVAGQNAFTSTTATLSALILQTSGTGQGSADVDAVSVAVPEPAAGAALMLAPLLLKRRRK